MFLFFLAIEASASRMKHYTPRVRARQEQLETDRTWPEDKPLEEVQTRDTGEPNKIIPLVSARNNGGGGGSRLSKGY
jgi:hypothetical protein